MQLTKNCIRGKWSNTDVLKGAWFLEHGPNTKACHQEAWFLEHGPITDGHPWIDLSHLKLYWHIHNK